MGKLLRPLIQQLIAKGLWTCVSFSHVADDSAHCFSQYAQAANLLAKIFSSEKLLIETREPLSWRNVTNFLSSEFLGPWLRGFGDLVSQNKWMNIYKRVSSRWHCNESQNSKQHNGKEPPPPEPCLEKNERRRGRLIALSLGKYSKQGDINR